MLEERKEPQVTGELVTERARIAGVEAGVAAGLVPSTDGPAPPSTDPAAVRESVQIVGGDARAVGPKEPTDVASTYELPNWTDPPTLQVPRVLLDLEQEAAAGRRGPQPPPPGGPVWRERQEDWDDTDAVLADLAGLRVTDYEESSSDDPFAYDFLELDEETSWVARPETPVDSAERVSEPVTAVPPPAVEPEVPVDSDAVGEFPNPPSPDDEVVAPIARRRRHAAPRSRAPRSPRPAVEPKAPTAAGARNPIVATLTGVLLGGILLLCFFAGPPAVLALVAVAVTLAAGELFNALRLAGYQPATLLGLLAVPAVTVAAYFRGPVAIVAGLAIFVAVAMLWYLVGVTRRSPVANLSVTVFSFCWIGVLAAFGGLLLDPKVFPHRHGIAFMLGAVIAAVGYDVGGYAVGSRLGRHNLAPAVSPHKTWEGLIGGCVVAIAASVAITSHIHPWSIHTALALGAIVAVVAPVGDLVESMTKRDLGVKDMGALLPGHGGMLDRIDALLFVLPAAYYFVRLAHVG